MSRPSYSLSRHPLVQSLLVGLAILLALAVWLVLSQQVLTANRIASDVAPAIDGDLSDPVWASARPVTVTTSHGGDFGGTGETAVTMRALHDDRFVYLSFIWDDPTRSLRHRPLIKVKGHWQPLPEDGPGGKLGEMMEDRFAIMFAKPSIPIIGAAIHLGHDPLHNGTLSQSGRGLHYTANGRIVDLLVWSAASTLVDFPVDDAHIGPPAEPNMRQRKGEERYAGGIAADEGHAFSDSDVMPADASGGVSGNPLVLPVTLKQMHPLPAVSKGLAVSDSLQDATDWVLPKDQAQAFSEESDHAFAEGAVIPGLVVQPSDPASPPETQCNGRWSAGRWALECRRPLVAGDLDDQAITSGTYLWVAAFDHARSRHSYHIRPVKLELL